MKLFRRRISWIPILQYTPSHFTLPHNGLLSDNESVMMGTSVLACVRGQGTRFIISDTSQNFLIRTPPQVKRA